MNCKYLVDKPMGKWAENLGNAVFMELEHFFTALRADLNQNLQQAAKDIALAYAEDENGNVMA